MVLKVENEFRHCIGIYALVNTFNNKRYIGSTTLDFRLRCGRHLHHLRRNTHGNHKLQQDWNLYGEEIFLFQVIEVVADLKHVCQREQHWLDSCSHETLYNILMNVNSYPVAKPKPQGRKVVIRKPYKIQVAIGKQIEKSPPMRDFLKEMEQEEIQKLISLIHRQFPNLEY